MQLEFVRSLIGAVVKIQSVEMAVAGFARIFDVSSAQSIFLLPQPRVHLLNRVPQRPLLRALVSIPRNARLTFFGHWPRGPLPRFPSFD